MGIPKERLSGFESFEAPDPAEWVPYGYAIVNMNARGILGSGGDHRWVLNLLSFALPSLVLREF